MRAGPGDRTVRLRPMSALAITTRLDQTRDRLLAGLAVTERRVRLAGISTALLEGGEGPPLVLLHGGIECGGAYWAPAIPSLLDSHRLVIPDVPGLGESEPVARLDPATFADWFAELLRATCTEKPALIAHSLLGTLAARFAAEHGDLLSRLMIYAAPGIGPYRMPLGLRVVAIRFALRPSEGNAERFDRWAFFDLDRARRRDPGWVEAFDAYTRSRAVVPHVKRTMRQLIGSATKQVPDAELRRIPVATDLVWARHDRFVPLGLAEGASATLGWPLHVIDEAGHVPHIERPDAFLRALRIALDTGSTRR
jgi:pimeloyl-ACP methyl ester carboxylesterase